MHPEAVLLETTEPPGSLESPPREQVGRGIRKVAQGMSDLAQVLPWGQDEAELVMELQAGSDAAFDWLVTHYHASVYNLVYGILSDAADAADVTQEVFLKAFRGIRGFRRGSSLKTWLYRITVREALNQRRWCWRHHRRQASIDAETEDGHAALELEDTESTPFEQLAARELQAAIRGALASVPEQFRSAVILRDLEGLSYEEVAEVLEVSVGTVKSRILRGRRALREILAPLLERERRPGRVRETRSSGHRRQRLNVNPALASRDAPGAISWCASGMSAAGFAEERGRGGRP